VKHIRRVRLENFQSHAHSELDFGPELNVITGPSDNGKSAVLRGIRWALYNEPRGSDFVRFGCRECAVAVTMSDGAEILRELTLGKSGTPLRNRYVVTAPGGEPQVFEGFGTEVPLEVTQAHGMSEVQLDTDKRVVLSFGSQMEGPFLMAETGSVRARAIGRLLGVHVVDAAIRDTQRDLKGRKAEIGRQEKELLRLETELAPYDDIAERELQLDLAEALLAEAETAAARLAELTRVRQELAARSSQAAAERETLVRTQQQLNADLAVYADVLKQAGRCPTCLQPIAPDAVERILAGLSDGADEHEH
jgi:exonuclease SbcC